MLEGVYLRNEDVERGGDARMSMLLERLVICVRPEGEDEAQGLESRMSSILACGVCYCCLSEYQAGLACCDSGSVACLVPGE